MSSHFRVVILTFDAMAIHKFLRYNQQSDEVDGFVDFGKTREQVVSSNALVFMIRSMTSKWKQVTLRS